MAPKFEKMYLVFQDCVECEPVASRLTEDYKLAGELGVEIEKLAFFKKGAPELIKKAAKAGVTLPFFSDGEKCAKHLAELVQGEPEAAETPEEEPTDDATGFDVEPVKTKAKKGK